LVTFVTLLLKPDKPPRIFEEKDETLLTTEAANAEPGILGIEIVGGGMPALEAAGIAEGFTGEGEGLGEVGS
jgi:hypothetical protein